ncbi:YgaP family membrane protein [Hippea maritima]|uniref:Inner membrane protein YgaP-like transmembrane domain-containing protein n=1 Tax=Hippea maritima (strain ATCC 700847 / DSM 10411 / MH2) TaxID=760142 RepID=F2LVW7_HIPMA|nr:DUF2892 domain-containing protein [Hippea maritima]AEA33901.1 hypothetical protein Hipma_0932 [Hippea maritima DSM 10411]
MKISLQSNIGGKDREFRLIGGAVLTLIGCLTKNHWIKAAGCVFLVTGIAKKCIFYDFLNINTNT